MLACEVIFSPSTVYSRVGVPTTLQSERLLQEVWRSTLTIVPVESTYPSYSVAKPAFHMPSPKARNTTPTTRFKKTPSSFFLAFFLFFAGVWSCGGYM